MIICDNVGPGTYPFTWDGQGLIAVTATTWDGQSVFWQWQDELGNWWPPVSPGVAEQNGVYLLTGDLSAGSTWQLVIATHMVGVSATVRKPALYRESSE